MSVGRQEVTQVGGGLGFLEALTLVFVAAKLFGAVSWSWWWVLAPLWIPFAVVAALLILFGIGALVYVLVT